MLLLFLFLGVFTTANAFTLCEYYEKIGVFKPECAQVRQTPVMNDFFAPKNDALQQFGTPLCRNYFHSCMSSTICESGTICSNGIGPGSCCTDPGRARCPSASALNINCRKARGVNWCNSDFECRGKSTMASMCCPTGCNYNINLVFSSLGTSGASALTCPDPYILNVKCVAQRPTSWCLTDDECPQNSLHPRKCCTTICGYNTCVVRYNGIWQIA